MCRGRYRPRVETDVEIFEAGRAIRIYNTCVIGGDVSVWVSSFNKNSENRPKPVRSKSSYPRLLALRLSFDVAASVQAWSTILLLGRKLVSVFLSYRWCAEMVLPFAMIWQPFLTFYSSTLFFSLFFLF